MSYGPMIPFTNYISEGSNGKLIDIYFLTEIVRLRTFMQVPIFMNATIEMELKFQLLNIMTSTLFFKYLYIFNIFLHVENFTKMHNIHSVMMVNSCIVCRT